MHSLPSDRAADTAESPRTWASCARFGTPQGGMVQGCAVPLPPHTGGYPHSPQSQTVWGSTSPMAGNGTWVQLPTPTAVDTPEPPQFPTQSAQDRGDSSTYAALCVWGGEGGHSCKNPPEGCPFTQTV